MVDVGYNQIGTCKCCLSVSQRSLSTIFEKILTTVVNDILVQRNTFLSWCMGSSVASPICQEGQSERTFPNFASSSRFSAFFPWFPLFFPILAIFRCQRWHSAGSCPPCTPSGDATVNGLERPQRVSRSGYGTNTASRTTVQGDSARNEGI